MCCRTLSVGTGGLARRSLSSLVRPFTQDTLNESPALDLFERGIHLAIITRPPGNIQFDRLVFSSPSCPLDSPHGKSPLRIQFAVVLPYTELFRFFKLRQYAGLTPLSLSLCEISLCEALPLAMSWLVKKRKEAMSVTGWLKTGRFAVGSSSGRKRHSSPHIKLGTNKKTGEGGINDTEIPQAQPKNWRLGLPILGA